MASRRLAAKTPSDMENMRVAGLVVAQTHAELRNAVKPGLTTKELDQIAYDVTIAAGARPNFLGYNGFSGSVCISVNEEIVHGIPGDRVLQPGDIVSFDCGAVVQHDGRPWHGDAAFTVVLDGGDDPELQQKRQELNAITETSMWAGIASTATARRVGDIGAAVEDSVFESSIKYGWQPDIVEGYTGHGIGNQLHEEPEVYNYRTRSRGPRIGPGMVLCIEPMLTVGDATSAVLADDWTVVTVNGLDAAHWEHTVAIGEKGIAVLTAFDAGESRLAPYGITPVRDFAN